MTLQTERPLQTALGYESTRPVAEATRLLRGPFLGRMEFKNVIFASDIHSSLSVTKEILDRFYGKADAIVFLGDYVDRGMQGVEVLELLCSKMLEGERGGRTKIIMLRGNHESEEMNKKYGFTREVGEKLGYGSYGVYGQFFSRLPFAAVVNNWFCVHGGLSMGIAKLDDISLLPWPNVLSIYDRGVANQTAMQLVWNDPTEDPVYFGENPKRGTGVFTFGKTALADFLSRNGLIGVIRGHESPGGIKTQMDGRLVTVSTTWYVTGESVSVLEFDNGRMYEVELCKGGDMYEVELQLRKNPP